jgi:hypothetical protein
MFHSLATSSRRHASGRSLSRVVFCILSILGSFSPRALAPSRNHEVCATMVVFPAVSVGPGYGGPGLIWRAIWRPDRQLRFIQLIMPRDRAAQIFSNR